MEMKKEIKMPLGTSELHTGHLVKGFYISIKKITGKMEQTDN